MRALHVSFSSPSDVSYSSCSDTHPQNHTHMHIHTYTHTHAHTHTHKHTTCAEAQPIPESCWFLCCEQISLSDQSPITSQACSLTHQHTFVASGSIPPAFFIALARSPFALTPTLFSSSFSVLSLLNPAQPFILIASSLWQEVLANNCLHCVILSFDG